jgi:ABC-type transport system substrate-binding protein
MRLQYYFKIGGAPPYISLSHTEEIDAVLDAAVTAPDFATKQQLTWKTQEYLFDELTNVIPLYVQDQISVKWPKVHNDGFSVTAGVQSTPEECWMEK